MRPPAPALDAIAVTIAVTEALDEIGVPYVIGGSVAGAIHGLARATMDVDIVVDLRAEQVDPLVHRLGGDYYADADALRDAVARRATSNLVHRPTMFKVDLFVLKARAWDREQLARRQTHVLSAERGWAGAIATAEDTVLAKLEWYRKGNEVSDRQWRDILGIVAVQGERLDRSYLTRWARELGVADLLDRALSEAET